MPSQKNKVTIDAVRHYMELGLILALKEGGQYDFDDRCQQDLDDLLSLKEMGFSLHEILTIFKFKRLGKLTDYEENDYYRGLFFNQLERIDSEIKTLKGYRANIERKLEEQKAENKVQERRTGLSLKALNLLSCHICSGELLLVEGSIEQNQIMNGTLKCTCGQGYTIDTGILCCPPATQNAAGKADDSGKLVDYRHHLSDYILSTDPVYVDNLNKGLEWVYKRLDFSHLKEKVLLELGTGFGYFLRYIYNDLPEDCLYIAVDHDVNKQRFLKGLLEQAGHQKNILFVCCDFLKLPIRHKAADVLFDISGTTNYSFDHQGFLLEAADKYVKDQAELIGTFILFRHFSHNSMIREDNRRNFVLEGIKASIEALNYQLIDESISDDIEKGGKYENYLAKGEKIYFYIYFGKREG